MIFMSIQFAYIDWQDEVLKGLYLSVTAFYVVKCGLILLVVMGALRQAQVVKYIRLLLLSAISLIFLGHRDLILKYHSFVIDHPYC